MITFIDLFYITASAAIIVLTAVFVPAVLQIRRTARKAERTLDTLNIELQPFLAKATETSAELQILSLSLNDKIEQTDKIIDIARESAETLASTAQAVKNGIVPVVDQISVLSAGIAAFSGYFKKNHSQQRR